MGKTFSFVSGALFGAAAGAIVGVALAPRSGAETRAMAADIANDAWDNMRDTYEHSAEEARAAVNDFGPMVDAKTDDLRAKVDLAASAWTSCASPAQRRHFGRQRDACRRRRGRERRRG